MALPNEQIQSALGDMYRIFAELPIEAQEWFVHQTCGLMERRNNTSLYSYARFKRIYELARTYGLSIENRSILEIGAGKPLGMGLFWNLAGAGRYTSIDKFVPVNLDDLWLSRFQWLIGMNLFRPAPFEMGDLVRKDGQGYQLNRERIDLIQGDFDTHPFQPESFDFISSLAVLAPDTGIESILKRMHHILRKGGTMIHLIDLREHHTHLRTVPDKDRSIDFMKYSRDDWEKLYPPGSEHYINRLRASDFRQHFLAAGFEIVDFTATQSMDITESVYADIDRAFHHYPLEDLRILAVNAVLRKRGR